MMEPTKNAFEVKWRIENIKSWFQDRSDAIYSPQFLAESLANTHWKLSLCPNWQFAEKYICLTLQRDVEDSSPELIILNYELSFLAGDGSPLKSKTRTKKFAPKTVSDELNVKEIDIFKGKEDSYLPHGVLTVGCKLWKSWSTALKEENCSIRSVIGIKYIILEGTIDHFSRLNKDSEVIVNFKSHTTDISLISLKLTIHPEGLIFERTQVECKNFTLISCSLYTFTAGDRKACVGSSKLAGLLNPRIPCKFSCFYSMFDFIHSFLENDKLALQLEIQYFPGINLEFIEYDVNNHRKLDTKSTNVESVSNSVSNQVHRSPLDLYPSEDEDKPCNIERKESIDEDECLDAESKICLSSTTLKEDLTSLYNDRLFCDTKLRTDSETFPAHRSVLSARSPIFKKMFTTDMKEKVTEFVNIPDISSDTIRRMLQFLYTDCTGDLDMQSAKDLYIVGDKYDISSLKQRCSSFMKKNLCPSNVCEVLVLADMHQDKDLQSAAQEYVLTYDEEVFCSDEWKLFMQNCSGIAAQVMYLKCTKKC